MQNRTRRNAIIYLVYVYVCVCRQLVIISFFFLFELLYIIEIMSLNWTFDHDDHSPFGSDEHIYQTEYYSLLITIFFFFIGLFGNLLMLIGNGYIIRHSYDGEKHTFENFLIEISCFDLIILLYHLMNSIIRYKSLSSYHTETMIGLINLSTVCCKLLTYIIRISTLMSHWLIILLLLNRLFLVYSKCYRFITIINAKYAV